MAIQKFPKNNTWNLEDLLCEYKKKINEIIDVLNTTGGGDIPPELVNTINQIIDRINQLDIEVASNTRNIIETNNRVLTNITDIENMKAEIELLKSTVGGDYTAIENRLKALELQVNDFHLEFNTKVGTIDTQLASLNVIVDSNTNNILDAYSSISINSDNIVELKNKNVIIESDILNLKQRLTILEQDFEPIISLFNTVQSELVIINNKITEINNRIDSIDLDIASIKNNIITIEATLVNQNARLEAIEGAGGAGEIQVVDSLDSTSVTFPLSANQGRVLKEMIDTVDVKTGNYFSNAEITIDKKLKLISANQELLLDLPDSDIPLELQEAVLNLDANVDGTISYGHLSGEITIKDTSFVNNVEKDPNGDLRFKRNTGDIVIPIGIPAKVATKIEADTINDGIGVTYSDADYQVVRVSGLPTISKSVKLINFNPNGNMLISLNNSDLVTKETPYLYDVVLDEVLGNLNFKHSNTLTKSIQLKSYIESVVTAMSTGLSVLSQEDFTKYYKIVDDIQVEITKEEYETFECGTKYYKLINGEYVEVTDVEIL